MYDSGKVIAGLIIFFLIMTSPIWYHIAIGKAPYVDHEIATKNIPGKDACVMDADYMKKSHMNLLNEWRDKVVREGKRIHVAHNGKKYNMSLSKTCMDCHSSKEKFCDRCHTYMLVDPYCWTCHVIPEEVKR